MTTTYVNGFEINEDHIKAEMQRLRPKYEQAFEYMSPDQRETQLYNWSKEHVIEQILIRQAADEQINDITDQDVENAYNRVIEHNFQFKQEDPVKVKAEIKVQLQIEKLFDSLTSDITPPNEQEIETFYNQNIENFNIPEMVRVSQILLPPNPEFSQDSQRHELENILKKIESGTPFEDIAKKYSDDSDSCGDLGFLARGKTVQEFEDIVFSMEVGEVSDIFSTHFGLHIAKLTARRDAEQCSLDQARESIIKQIMQEHKDLATERFIETLKANATINHEQ